MSNMLLSKSTNRTYTLVDKDEKYYLSSWYNPATYGGGQGYQNQINLLDFNKTMLYNTRPFSMTFEQAEGLVTTLENIAPIDMRVFLNNVEITDNAVKATLFASLLLSEYKIESTNNLRTLSAKDIKIAKQEAAVRANLQALLSNTLNGVASLSYNNCKKLQTALGQ